MGLIHDEKVYGLKIRESADDGSDFGTPDADYRFLFLGEDGDLHLKDASDTVTDVGGGVASAPAVVVYTRNSTNYTTTSTTPVDIDGTNLSQAITVAANSRVRVTLVASVAGTSTGNIFVDVLVDGTSVSGGEGVNLARPLNTGSVNMPIGFSWITDALSAGARTIKLQWWTSTGTATMYAGAGGGPILQFSLEEIPA